MPQVGIVFDHFHVIKYFNDKLSDLRRQLYHQTNERQERQELKGLRWTLLKNPEHLDETKDEKAKVLIAILIQSYFIFLELSFNFQYFILLFGTSMAPGKI